MHAGVKCVCNVCGSAHLCGCMVNGTFALSIINPQRACARVTVVVLCVCVCLSVCLSVTTFSPTSRNKTAKKRYVWLYRYTSLILKLAIFVKVLHSKVMA